MNSGIRKKICGRSGYILLCAAVSGALLVSLKYGAVDISWQSIWDFLCGTGSSDSPDIMILNQIRLPRTLCAMLSGAALAVSGAILQSVLNNQLASPGITGVSAGGGLAGIIAMVYFPGSPERAAAATFCGALAIAVSVFILAWKSHASPLKIILAGVALSSICAALSGTVIFLNSEKAGELLSFTTGSLTMCNRDNLAAVFPFAAIGFTGAILMAKQMDILALGDDTASSLGIPVFRSRLLLLLFSALLAASAVSLAGLMGFIGLIVPHALRLILKSFSNRKLLTYSAICGAVLLTLCDTIGRTVAAPAEIPAGIITALLGPPFFFYLLFRKGSSL